jgi:large subunit ribosomal protein L25
MSAAKGVEARNDVVAVTTRTKTGTTSSKALRHAGKIPAVLSGHGSEPINVAIDAKRFDELLHSGARHHMLHVTIDGKTKETAVIRDVERDPISRRVVHADLQRVSATEAIEATLQLHTEGTAAGARDGGVVDIVAHELTVKGPANSIPESLTVDISALNIHDVLTAANVPLPSGFSLVSPPDTVIVTIAAPRTAVEPAPETPAAETPAAAAPEASTP